MHQFLSSDTTPRLVLLLGAVAVGALLYASAMWRGSVISEVPSTGGAVERAIELTIDRGAVGYTGG